MKILYEYHFVTPAPPVNHVDALLDSVGEK